MVGELRVFFGAFTYEFRMQVRRPAVWITLLLLELLLLSILSRQARVIEAITSLRSSSMHDAVVYWTNITNEIFPMGVGILLADRLPRDRRTKTDELFAALPGSTAGRLLGKYLGSLSAAMLPVLLLYCIGIGFIAFQTQNYQAVPLALATFVTIVLPGMLFVGAFSIACPAIMWVPLYQFFFIGYWFWGNHFHDQTIPSLSDTMLTPVGGYASQGFFGVNLFIWDLNATPLQAIESILLLLGLAAFVMVTLQQFLAWQRARQ